MRTIVLALLPLAGISLTSTDADAGAWCASYRRGEFLVRAMPGHRSRPGGILPAKSIPRNGLRDGRRKLEYPRLAAALPAQLLDMAF
jgi:hypothetical protein